jgi:hypothetical protein
MAKEPLGTDHGKATTIAFDTWRKVQGETLPALASQLETLAVHPLGG